KEISSELKSNAKRSRRRSASGNRPRNRNAKRSSQRFQQNSRERNCARQKSPRVKLESTLLGSENWLERRLPRIAGPLPIARLMSARIRKTTLRRFGSLMLK